MDLFAPCSYTETIYSLFLSFNRVTLDKQSRVMEIKTEIRIKDIARKANVSIGTVDRVLHNRGEVSEETRRKILDIIEEMDYRPNLLASTLASRKRLVTGVLLPTPLSPDGYWTKPVEGIRKAVSELRQYGITAELFTFNQSDPSDFREKARKLLATGPDGVVFAPFFAREATDFISRLKENQIPFVFIDSNLPGQGQLTYIGQNSYQCGQLSARLLSMLVPVGDPLLVIHYARETDHQNHLLQRELGFYDWFRIHRPAQHIKTTEIALSDPAGCDARLMEALDAETPAGLFVTSSKVYLAARVLENAGLSAVRIIGNDLLRENVRYLRNGTIDFLICQRPEEQGFHAIEALFRSLVLKLPVPEVNYSPIEIITRENLDYYKEFKS